MVSWFEVPLIISQIFKYPVTNRHCRLNSCSWLIAHFVARDGILLYEKRSWRIWVFSANFTSESELKKFRQDQRQLIEMELKSGSMTDIDSEVVIVRLRLIAKYRNTLEEFNLLPRWVPGNFRQQLIVERPYSQWLKLQQILIHIFWCSYIKLVRQHTLTLFIEGTARHIITPELAAKLAQSAGNAKHFSSSV